MPKKAGSKKSDLVKGAVKLSKEYQELQRVTELERKGRKELVEKFRSLQGWVGKSVPIPGSALATDSPQIKEAYVTSDCVVVTVGPSGAERKTPLEELEPSVFVSVIQDFAPKLRRLVLDKKRELIEAGAPRIELRTTLAGSQVLLFDWRQYRLTLANKGGDARDLRLSAGGDVTQNYGPFAVRKGDKIELSLRRFRALSSAGSVPVTIRCRDEDGHEYEGNGTVKLETDDWQEVRMSLKEPEGLSEDHW
ncbi:MAG: hypothetical protein JRN11_07990 [Nitrososphaerota archaeon]|nr:hypothetical protein [Nitrososphaerota archaeon]MDG6951564.1 hypothetical protein [Nitrososphaerota archaeon]MDG6968487.1 hypothetical protein [Nitrososphaerota archaeon]MDG6987507.1 hypothetical protein [Nitrososphaerota archaeon]MDG6990147.1 hypothetical protein [Nitrososphaerota archaeon]